MKNLLFFRFLLIIILLDIRDASGNWLDTIGGYLGYHEKNVKSNEIFEQKIPYEVSTADENFIKEAAKLTDLALSELDSCQHRVILKLKTDCNHLNDEQLAKMAVHLLNCQSWVEGRPTYPCTDEMSIKDCTITMDSDTWTSYHLMSNRARAVCYTVRQSQFRGLAEHTVNRLMDAARNQLQNLNDISSTQIGLKNLAEKTFLTLSEGQKNLFEQHDNLKKAQFHGQLVIEDNIKRLADEKRLIAETHNNLVQMTRGIQQKLEISLEQLQDQTEKSKINHREILNDLLVIQEKTKDIFSKIEQSSSLLIQQNEDFNYQYQSTIRSLKEMNKTVSDLVSIINITWASLEVQLNKIIGAVGGTDMAVEKIYLIIWHSAVVLLGMLTCAFLSAPPLTRLSVVIFPPLNLTAALFGTIYHLNFDTLVATIIFFGIVQTSLLHMFKKELERPVNGMITWKRKEESVEASRPTSTTTPGISTSNGVPFMNKEYDVDNYSEITPPASRSYTPSYTSSLRSRTPQLNSNENRVNCIARTKVGTPCKNTTVWGDYCYRHQYLSD